jgi:N-acetylglucosamine malate deacetylase 1
MDVLAIAPHPDDESIGCGGTLRLHVERGDRVTCVFLTSGELGLKELPREEAWAIREAEARAAADVLGFAGVVFLRNRDWYMGEDVLAAAEGLRRVLTQVSPSTIYLPHASEAHPDHRAAAAVLASALSGNGAAPPTLLAYEVWTPLASWDHVEDVTPVMKRKLQAVRCYPSQVGQLRYDRAVRGLNLYRGVMAGGCRYAEVFQLASPGSPSEGEASPV